MSVLCLPVKELHVLLTITALGANIPYGVWLARASGDPRSPAFALTIVFLLVTKPAF